MKRWLPWVILALLALAVFSFKAGSYPLTDQDETLYSGVGRELLQHGDWWTLYWGGKPWFIHAPMSMWIQAAFFKVFGVSELVARMSAILFGTGLVLLTAAFGCMLFNRRTGLIAGLIMISSPMVYIIARLAILDMPFVFFITLSIYLYVRSIKTGNKWLYPAFWASAGIATLCKGLWGVVLASMICFLYTITGSDRKKLWDFRIYLPVLVWAAVVAPWFYINAGRWGESFTEPVIAINTWRRLTDSVCQHTGSWYYYLPVIFFGMFPWSFIGIKGWIKRNGDSGRLLLVWIIPALLLHSVAGTKLSNYMLPLSPALALMFAAYFSDLKRTRVQGVFMVVFAVLMGSALIYGMRYVEVDIDINVVQMAVWITVGYLAAAAAFIFLKKRATPAAAVCMALALSVFPVVFTGAAHDLFPKNIALQAREVAGENAVVTLDGVPDVWGVQSMPGVPRVSGVYYYAQLPFIDAWDVPDLKRIISENPKCALVLPAEMMEELAAQGVKVEKITTEGQWTLARPSPAVGD